MKSPVARGAVLALTALAAGCAVAPLPNTVPMRGQSPLEQAWDVSDCKAEISYQTHYSPTDSPLGNWFQSLFFWGTSGAALGAAITGWPTPAVIVTGPGPTVVPSVTAQTSEGVIAGAAAGAIPGTALAWGGQSRFERGWVACMEAKGYSIAPPEAPRSSVAPTGSSPGPPADGTPLPPAEGAASPSR